MGKKEYIIPVSWEMYGRHTVYANSLKEAMKIADEEPLPDGEYVDDSWKMDLDIIPEDNKLSKKDKAYYEKYAHDYVVNDLEEEDDG